jgi:hypothetical protein
MTEDSIQRNLRVALYEIIAKEKVRLRDLYDGLDAEHQARVAKMAPVNQALIALRDQLVDLEGIAFSLAPDGHVASITINSSTSHHRLSISTTYGDPFSKRGGNTHYTVEESQSFSFDSHFHEGVKKFETADTELRIVIDAVGKHIAQRHALAELKARTR